MDQDSFLIMGMNMVADVRESKRQLDNMERDQKKSAGIGKKRF